MRSINSYTIHSTLQMTEKGANTRGHLGSDVDERFRVLSPDPVSQSDGVQYYEVQSPLVKGRRGLVPIEHCSPQTSTQ